MPAPRSSLPSAPGVPGPVTTTPGSSYTSYNPKPGLDPIFDAWKANYAAKMATAGQDADFNTAKIQDEYDRGVAQLKLQAPGERKGLENSLLSRGVGRGGEALRRRADLEAGVTNRMTDAERARLEGVTTVQQQLARQYGDMAAENETQIGASRVRLGSQAPDATTPGYVKPKSTKPKPKAKPSGGGGTTKPVDYYGYANQWV